MERITTKHLETLLQRLRRETGAPEMRWTPRAGGKGNECPVGALFIEPGSTTYGRAWALCETVNESGAQKSILRASTARELYHLIHAYMDGMDAARRAQP